MSACVEAYDRLKMEDNGKVLELRRQRYGELAVKDVITDTRTLNILKRMKIGKVSEMAVLSEEELKKIPWCGKHVIGNIKNALERAGMKLRAS
ncbi:MAG: DNA-directed RNA polymerase subunit alpha C-terminal domain-containing protein [Bacteroidales bacterium]|nr:DNA-directed RNA polymerase subunit alpha C-terminal domain-containing protein [Bacteroidales bacterium]